MSAEHLKTVGSNVSFFYISLLLSFKPYGRHYKGILVYVLILHIPASSQSANISILKNTGSQNRLSNNIFKNQ